MTRRIGLVYTLRRSVAMSLSLRLRPQGEADCRGVEARSDRGEPRRAPLYVSPEAARELSHVPEDQFERLLDELAELLE